MSFKSWILEDQNERANIADGIVDKTCKEIMILGKWRFSSLVAEAETEVAKAYHGYIAGTGSLEVLKYACEQWKHVGTKHSQKR